MAKLPTLTLMFAVVMMFVHFGFAQDDAKKEEAKRHFEQGKVFYKQSEYLKAIEEFQKAYSLYPHSVILYNIAQAYEKEGNIPMALRFFREYLRASPNAEDRNTVLISIQNLEKKLQEKGIQQVGIYSTPPEADVAINGKVVGKTPFTIELRPGKYILSLTKKGYIPIDKEFTVSPDRSLELDFTLNELNMETAKAPVEKAVEPPVEEKKEEIRPVEMQKPDIKDEGVKKKAPQLKLWSYIIGGTGVALIGAGAVFGIMANSSESDLKSEKNVERTQEEVQRIADNAQRYAMVANILYGAGAALGISAAVIYFIGDKEEATNKRASLMLSPYKEGFVVSFGGNF